MAITAAMQAAGQANTRKSLVAAWYGLAALVLATVFAQMDRQILMLVAQPLKQALGLSDTQIGAMNGIALSLVAMLATFPLGWLADRVDRRRLLALCIIIWSIFTAACGFARNFPQLFTCSMGIAVGEAVLGPVSYAFVADLFPTESWMLANYIYYLAAVLGSAAGMTFSGAVIGFAGTYHALLPLVPSGLEPWRVALLIIALPGPVIALLVALIRISARAPAAEAANAVGLAGYVRENARTFVGVFVGFGLAAASSGAVAAWTPVVLERAFAQSPAQTGVRLGAVSAAATLLGVLISGLMARKLRARLGRLTALRISEAGVIAALLTVPVFLSAASAWQVYLAIGIHTIAVTVCLSLSPTILQFMAPRLMRGRVIALGGLLYMVFMSLTPLLVGGISDRLTAGSRGLLLAIIIVGGPCYLMSFFFMRFAEPTLARTFEAVEAAE